MVCLLLSGYGGMACKDTVFYKQLAGKLSDKTIDW